MSKLVVSGIYVYPIKSLGGISLSESLVEEKGLQYDRRWVLTDDTGLFITQRKYPLLSLLQVSISDDVVTVFHKENPKQKISFGISQQIGEQIPVTIWDDLTKGIEVDAEVSKWFSDYMNMEVKLLRMPEQERRNVDSRYAGNDEIVSFADGYPCLIIGQSSLDELNTKLEKPILMDRFRPNIVFTGGEPHAEDGISEFEIDKISFSAVKPCARCVLVTVDQQHGTKSPEPLKTLAKYRTLNNKIMFGQNLIHKGSGSIKIGAEIKIKSTKEKIFS
ncbi:MOSC domain-containing protein [Pedobacter sp. Leaf176]|uniref:MOSC domain-containing protein n=1 Tax=Pedobacter sp. Leaf176 TaxID=1736286 RepID=UPI0006F351AA|nr:MOSC N-terminal beta barrel domain-containing protein [Pedobacter sp. Leaf176]KQR70424.1 oxidoreductase [Pedobacter sp. Leaf176]